MDSNAITIFFLGMLVFIMLKPKHFYKEDGVTFKCWRDINFDDMDTLFNIYVYAVVVAIFSHYVCKAKTD